MKIADVYTSVRGDSSRACAAQVESPGSNYWLEKILQIRSEVMQGVGVDGGVERPVHHFRITS